ncbi:cytochrome c2 [Stylonychia lemnae]|uniref:Cytochrome c2 n=1 Tax=Stylonychia lemnae TaxID=5949 RepID=A0A078ALX7_STYLE|nr:cytochrome c2 [Stylonychia lemnae]|eukprot:CDW82397.1 cytochrome c2 [Stylonychia lemnae]
MPPKKKKATGDAAKGERVFKNLCAACHSLSAHSTGPALGGLPGNNIASGEGFNYSSALAAKATLKWTDGNLDKWLKAPAEFAPGNGMAFAGIASSKDRADIIAYLKGG